MFYDAELTLLRQTFYKCRIQSGIVELGTPLGESSEYEIFPFAAEHLDMTQPLSVHIPPVRPGVIYRLHDAFDCRYLYLLLPERPREAVLVLGPYLSEAITDRQILERSEAMGLPPARLPELIRCCSNVPILPESSHLFVLLDSFCERLWRTGSVTLEDLGQYRSTSLPPVRKDPQQDRTELWNIQALEQRYQYENQLMDAVAKGQAYKSSQLFANMSTFFFEQRTSDTLRNAKNYCVIMNTILRKAAERGGVHPMYLDRASSTYAVRIEHASSTEDIPALMTEMFQSYCRLVRDHATRNYSSTVQRAVLYIDANLSESLTLHTLAEKLSVSAGYLSTLFKRETGHTLTDYVNHRRIDYARHLLTTTRLQIQTIAQHCGIVDVQYFSKIFKRITGKTPKAYRLSP